MSEAAIATTAVRLKCLELACHRAAHIGPAEVLSLADQYRAWVEQDHVAKEATPRARAIKPPA